jgi:tetratricopeptide (TPR) repeat protein
MALLVLSLVVTGCSAARRLFAQHRVSRGEAHLVAYDMEAALAEFRAAAELDPQLAVAHSRMGVIYRRMGEYDAAIDCFVEAVRHDPFSFNDAFNLGQLYHFTERVKEAIQAYLHAVELQPEDFDAQLNLGV